MSNIFENLPQALKSESSKITIIFFGSGTFLILANQDSKIGLTLILIGGFLALFLFVYFFINDSFKEKINETLGNLEKFIKKISDDNESWKKFHNEMSDDIIKQQKTVVEVLQSTVQMYGNALSEKTTQTSTGSENKKYETDVDATTMN